MAWFEMLFDDGIHLITGIENNMKNELVSLRDKFLLRKRPAIKTINDELKNICEIEYSRHRGKRNFIINIIAALAACCIFPKKSVIKFEKGDANQSAPLF